MWEFEKHNFQDLENDKDFTIRCADYAEPISGFKLPRGRGGVSILWPAQWSSRIKKLTEGNERIICMEMIGTGKSCFINVYLPTNNSAVNSHTDYAECLDILDNIITKYRLTHKIILCGDFNGRLFVS